MKPFSIILPNTDSALIGEIIRALQNQTVDLSAGELLVVGSDTPGLVQAGGPVRMIPTGEDQRCASDRRNLGMRLAQGEILFFLDDDCLPRPDWLERHLDCHARGERVVGGSVEFAKGGYVQLADNLSAFHFIASYTPASYRPYLCTANLSVHRSVMARCGAMQPGQNRAEDLEWTARFRQYGYQLFFEPQAAVLHDPDRRSLASFWRHWWEDAPRTLAVRLRHAELLGTPRLARHRPLYLWAAPCIAAWASLRVFAHPCSWLRYAHTLPLVYLSKLIWCWSAYQNFPRAIP